MTPMAHFIQGYKSLILLLKICIKFIFTIDFPCSFHENECGSDYCRYFTLIFWRTMRILYSGVGWMWRVNYGVFLYAFLLKSAPHAHILTSITAEMKCPHGFLSILTLYPNFKATNGDTQWCSDNKMQTLIYLGTSWYFNTKSIYCLKA